MHHRISRTAARTALAGLATGGAVALVLVAAPGWAHVTITPDTAEQGGDAAIGFVVPTESDTASTTKIAVYMPEGHPIASVDVRPHPGWSVKVVTTKLSTPLHSDDGDVSQAVASVTWTADSKKDAIHPGQYDEFDLSVGPLPDVSSLTFKALQTYSDGTIVRWIDPPAPAGEPEPAHPAPKLVLLPASDTGSSGSSGSMLSMASSGVGGGGKATAALGLSIVAVLLAFGALANSLRRRGPG